MENTVVDSNSESDISDSWAVIDDDSSLEWNNEIALGLRPPQYDFVKSRIPGSSSSKSELSDDDSIEVVPEDHTDNLSDREAEVVQDEWTGTNRPESKENICTETLRPTPDLLHYAAQLKKINLKWRESNLILIAILIMGILGGLGLGYLASHSYKSEDSTSIQPTRALLTKLENEIHFLHRQLRSAQSALKSAVSKTMPKLNRVTKHDQHNNTKGKPFKVVYPGMCSITDFIVKSPVLQDNFSKEYCLASDRPQANKKVGTTNSADNMSDNIAHTSSSSNSDMKNHVEVNTGVNNVPNEYTAQYIPYDVKQIDKTFQESIEKSSFEPLDTLHDVNTIEAVLSSDAIASKTSGTSAGNKKISNSDGRSDPRPYTKLRTTLERIYTILSFIDNENQNVFPSQLELISILPQNIVALDLSKGHFTTSMHNKITSFAIQMQDTTEKLFADIDSSINNFVQHIAFKIKEIETFNKKQICNLKTSLESSADFPRLDLDRELIFQQCVQEDTQNNHDDLVKSENKHKVKDSLTGSKEIYMVSESSTSDQKKTSDQLWMVKGKEYIYHKHKHRNENVQQSDSQHLNLEFGETSSGFGDKKGSVLNKKSPKTKKVILENKLKESTGTPVQPKADSSLNHKSKKGHSDKEMKPKTGVKTAKNNKSSTKHSELNATKKHDKSGIKRKFNSAKEKKYNIESHGKDQENINKSSKWMVNMDKTSNVSGEWAIKMAHGRAEQRRRDHQSDWVFERAKSRMSKRRKSIKESYWHNDPNYSSKFFKSPVCNKTMHLKDQTSKSWKRVKERMKKNLWKPLIDSTKSVKKAFNKFNNKIRYHSRQE